MKKIILASQSPRRREILQQVGLHFQVIPSRVKEDLNRQGSIGEKIGNLALRKAVNVADRLTEEAVVIGADTVVIFQDQILGKPRNKQEAFYMLKRLSGKNHQVITGLAVVNSSTKKQYIGHEITHVTMRNYGQGEINSYINSGECWDKAGSYAIQGLGALLAKRIQGDYFNVVGLPIGLLDQLLKKMDLDIFSLYDKDQLK